MSALPAATVNDARGGARAQVRELLEGGPRVDEDLILFAVRRLEHEEPQWLLAQVVDRRHPFARRVSLAGELGQHRAQALDLLRAELDCR